MKKVTTDSMKKFNLKKNAEVTVCSLSSKDKVLETRGIFKGYTLLNQISAMIIKIPGKKERENLRLIPEHMILSIDLHKNGDEEEEDLRENEGPGTHYA